MNEILDHVSIWANIALLRLPYPKYTSKCCAGCQKVDIKKLVYFPSRDKCAGNVEDEVKQETD